METKLIVSNDVIDHIIALSAAGSNGVKSVYALKNNRLSNTFHRFLKTEIKDGKVNTYIVIENGDYLSFLDTSKEVRENIKVDLMLMLGLELEKVDIEFI